LNDHKVRLFEEKEQWFRTVFRTYNQVNNYTTYYARVRIVLRLRKCELKRGKTEDQLPKCDNK